MTEEQLAKADGLRSATGETAVASLTFLRGYIQDPAGP